MSQLAMDIGISESDRQAITDGRSRLLAVVVAAHDEPTADLLTQRLRAHEKSASMLRSLLV